MYNSPSEFLKRKLVEGGYAPEQVYVKPNFVAPDPGQKQVLGDYVLYSGRLTATKGIETLIEAYESDATLPPLRVDGHGDMQPQIEALAAKDPRVIFEGSTSRAGVFQTMSRARLLVLSSIWYENFPVTIPEAFAHGLPIVASDIGALADLIQHDVTGLRFRPRDAGDLAAKIHEAWQPDVAKRLGDNARYEYVTKFTGERNYEQLIGAYEAALTARGGSVVRRAVPA
jgi:glycosyltransferase involved in cell wall biosynthesis